jgi:hypothetical protein
MPKGNCPEFLEGFKEHGERKEICHIARETRRKNRFCISEVIVF